MGRSLASCTREQGIDSNPGKIAALSGILLPGVMQPVCKLVVVILLVLVLNACATQSTKIAGPAAEQSYQQRFDFLASLTEWTLAGRLAASNSKDGGSGSLSWQKQGSHMQLAFRGALGKGAWELTAVPGQASLRFADGREYSAPDIAQLITAHMQAKVPVDALSWWVLGLAHPDDWADRQLDEVGRITHLRQLGWDVSFSNYKFEDQVWLPGKLVARNEEHSVKLAISKWSLTQAEAAID
jgi:outer membrane lipoprotein LolB